MHFCWTVDCVCPIILLHSWIAQNYLCTKIQLNIHHLNSYRIVNSGISKDHLKGAFICSLKSRLISRVIWLILIQKYFPFPMEKNRTFLDARSSVFSLKFESCVWCGSFQISKLWSQGLLANSVFSLLCHLTILVVSVLPAKSVLHFLSNPWTAVTVWKLDLVERQDVGYFDLTGKIGVLRSNKCDHHSWPVLQISPLK